MATENWFIGLTIPCGRWFAALAPPPPGARAFHPDDLHATVAFLGACGEERAQAAWEIARCIPVLGPFDLRPGVVRPFGDPRRPSAYSVVPADGARAMAAFIGAHRDALCAAAGARLDTREPKPHVTVARPTRKATAAQRDALSRWASAQSLPGDAVRVDQLALYTWAHDRRERLFRVVAARSLSG